MIRIWAALALLAASWLPGLGYFEPVSWPAWAVMVTAAVLLLAGGDAPALRGIRGTVGNALRGVPGVGGEPTEPPRNATEGPPRNATEGVPYSRQDPDRRRSLLFSSFGQASGSGSLTSGREARVLTFLPGGVRHSLPPSIVSVS